MQIAPREETVPEKTLESENMVASAIADAVNITTDWNSIEWDQRPKPNQGGPTKIELVITIKRWEINSASGHEVLFVDGKLEVYWRDERLIGYPLKEKLSPNMWRPQFITCPGFNLGTAETYELMPTFYGSNSSDFSNGNLQMICPFDFGQEGMNISDDLDRMRLFPFDSTRVDISAMFCGRRKDMLHTHIQPSFTRANTKNRVDEGHPLQHIDWMVPRHSDDYEMVCFSYALGAHPPPPFFRLPEHDETTRVADLLLSFHIKRTPTFYVSKGIRPLFMVAMFGLVVFGLEPEDLGTRISVLAALFLTAFAVQWVTIERIPRLPFSTVLDHVAQSVVNALLLMCVGALLSYRLGRPNNNCAVNNDDDGECQFDIMTGTHIDMIAVVAVSTFLLFETFLYRIVYSTRRATKVSGWARPWSKGPHLRNRRFVPYEAYRLVTDEEFVLRNGNKFLGAGTCIDEPEVAF